MLELDDSVVVGTLVLFIVIFICTVVWCWRKMLSISWQEHRTEVRVAVCLYVRGTPMSALTHNIRTICLYQSTRSHSALFKCCSIKFPVSFNLELFLLLYIVNVLIGMYFPALCKFFPGSLWPVSSHARPK